MVDEAPAAPKTEKVEFASRLTGSMEAIRTKTSSSLPLYSISLEGSRLTASLVESRNIRKMPYLFEIIILEPEKAGIIYTMPPDTSESLRRAAVISRFAGFMAIVADQYIIDNGTFLQYVDSAIMKLQDGMSQTYSTLFNKYEALLAESRELKRLNGELTASNYNLTVQTAALNDEKKILSEQLASLQKYSDEALMSMVEEWIETHNNAIEINEFSKSYSIAPTRVEEILDKMVSHGYLELRE